MRVVVIGATGNIGMALLRTLKDDAEIDHIVGIARRPPGNDPVASIPTASITESAPRPFVNCRTASIAAPGPLSWSASSGSTPCAAATCNRCATTSTPITRPAPWCKAMRLAI